MGELSKCINCEIEFEADTITKLCYECRKDDRLLFGIIRDFLYANPGASVNDVVTETGVTSNVVLRFLREGRLETVGLVKLLNCDVCGKKIAYGTHCQACNEKLTRSFTSVANVKSRNTDSHMHTKLKKK